MESLKRDDIVDNVVVIKVGKSYRDGMSGLELYDITRGCWKRKIESVQKADYALCVYKGVVKEAYRIEGWFYSDQEKRTTIPYDPEKDSDRIIFRGEIAPEEIRERYVGKSVANLYKWGEADPVKVFYTDATEKKSIGSDINFAEKPILIIQTDEIPLIVCPRCEYTFEKAPRCPECGQLIDFGTAKWNKPKLKDIDEWATASTRIIGADPIELAEIIKDLAAMYDYVYPSVGAVDASLWYKNPNKKGGIQLFMFFGKSDCGAVQPKAIYDFLRDNQFDEMFGKTYLDSLRCFLSDKQKNKPYVREEGYYFLEYNRIIDDKDSFLNTVKELLDVIDK